MFNIFNIAKSPAPVLEAPVQIRKPKPAVAKKAPSVKEDAEMVLERLLNDLQNVNNPKVDVLRMLAISLEKGDLTGLKAFCKEPIKIKKVVKKTKSSWN